MARAFARAGFSVGQIFCGPVRTLTPEKVIGQMKRTWTKFWRGFVQKHVSNRVLIWFLNLLAAKPNMLQRARADNRELQRAAITAMAEKGKYKEGTIINNQNEWGNVIFGGGKNSSMAYSGCEIIAVYNALVSLGEQMTGCGLADLIAAFERRGAVRKGEWGVTPTAVYDYMKQRFGNDRTVSWFVPGRGRQPDDNVDQIGRQHAVLIATVYNNADDITGQIHTVCIAKQADGTFAVQNAGYRDQDGNYAEKGGFKTLSEAVSGISANPQLISCVCIADAG